MKILWIFLGGYHKIILYLGVISMHFGVFFKVKVQNGVFLGVAKIQIFLGVLEIPVFYVFFVCVCVVFFFFFFFFGGGVMNGRCWARAYV